MTTSEWKPYSGPDDIQVGNKFSYPSSWGPPDDPNSIVTEITAMEGNKFWWEVTRIGRKDHAYKVGSINVLGTGSGWLVLKPFEELAYDPTQMGDKDDDI